MKSDLIEMHNIGIESAVDERLFLQLEEPRAGGHIHKLTGLIKETEKTYVQSLELLLQQSVDAQLLSVFTVEIGRDKRSKDINRYRC